MKNAVKLLFALTICLLALVSCSLPFGGEDNPPDGGGGDGQSTLPEDVIIVLPDAEAEGRTMSYVFSALRATYNTEYGKDLSSVTDAKLKSDKYREIVFGSTSRPISEKAMAALPEIEETDVHVFSILAEGGDIAIVANTDAAYKIAAEWFCKNMIKDFPTDTSETYFTTESIRAKEGSDARCFEIAKLEKDVFIDSVTVGSVEFEDFDADTLSYNFTVSVRDSIPEIAVAHPSFIESEITNADELNTTATVTLTSKDGSTVKTYTFNFTKEEASVVSDAFVEKVYGGKDSIVVIVHDDGTHATVDYMAGQFETYGLVGTLGLITNKLASKGQDGSWVLNNTEVAYWKSILKKGVFDVASHSHTHTFWGLSDEEESGWYLDSSNNIHEYHFEAGRITEEVAGSREILKLAFPDQDVLAFIKPGFGRVTDEFGTTGMTQISDKAYEIIAENFIGMRDTGGGVNTIPVTNILKVNSFVIRGSHTANDWKAEVNTAINKNGMTVFLFHTILENPDASSLSGKMSETDIFFEWLGEKSAGNEVWNTHLEDAMLYTEEYRNANLTALDLGDCIRVSVSCGLDTDIYNHPLTVNVPVPEGVTSVVAEYADGTTEELEIVMQANGGYVRCDLIPDGESVTLFTY